MSGIFNIEHYVMTWYLLTVSRSQILVYCKEGITLDLVKKKQVGLIPTYLK